MKKIILVGPAHPLRGGISDSNESWALALSKLHHEVEIVSYKMLYPRLLFPGKTPLRTTEKEFPIPIHPFPTRNMGKY